MATTSADILVRAVMTGSTGLAEDKYINDFAFHFDAGGTPTNAQIDDIFSAVDEFYNTSGGTGNSVSDYIGEAVNRAATHELQAYTIAVPMGSPRYTDAWLGPAAPATANVNLPTEVAAVVSFHGDLTGVLEESGATHPRARRRGRLYVGPLTMDAITPTADNPLLSNGVLAAMREGIVTMADAASADGWTFSVWSRSAATLYPVVAGWTDNAPDTQRRRGITSTARVTYGPI